MPFEPQCSAVNAGSREAKNNVLQVPRITQQLDQLGKSLSGCHECAARIENAADRLVGPDPECVSKEAESQPDQIVERRLAALITSVDALASRLGGVVSKLNSAV